jgi:hypothetical protein
MHLKRILLFHARRISLEGSAWNKRHTTSGLCVPRIAVAHTVFATSCRLNSCASHSACSSRVQLAQQAPPRLHSKCRITQSVLATSCGLNSPDIVSTRPSSSPISRSPGFLPVVAYAPTLPLFTA